MNQQSLLLKQRDDLHENEMNREDVDNLNRLNHEDQSNTNESKHMNFDWI